MKTIAMLALLTAAALPAPAGLGGKVEWWKDLAAVRGRAQLEQRAVVLFFGDSNCVVCQGLSEGALSNDRVVAAFRQVLPFLVDCTDPKPHEGLMKEFDVTGFPTLVIADPHGKKIKEIEGKDADAIVAALDEAGKRFPGTPVLWERTLEAAMEKAKAGKKPVGIYFHDGKEEPAKLAARIAKDLGKRTEKAVWVELVATNDEKDETKLKYKYESLPCIGILDPRKPDPAASPLGMIEILKGDKAETVNKYVDKALEKYKK